MASEAQCDVFFESARSDIKDRSADFEARVDPILEDLEVVAGDELRPRPGEPFYGWVLGDRSPLHEQPDGRSRQLELTHTPPAHSSRARLLEAVSSW